MKTRIPGPLGLRGLFSERGFLDLGRGARLRNRVPTAWQPVMRGSDGELVQRERIGPNRSSSREFLDPVGFHELVAGAQGIFDINRRPIDATSFDWLSPFRLLGKYTVTPGEINDQNKRIRDQTLQVLSTGLAYGLGRMAERTRHDKLERGSFFLRDGRLGAVIVGENRRVYFTPRRDANPIGEVHTHPPSPLISPPSYREDYRHYVDIVLVLESGSGRLWHAFWGGHAMLLGRISGLRFQPLSTDDPRYDIVFTFR